MIGYNRGTPDLYPHQTKAFYLVLTIRPRFVGRAARLRAATLPIIDVLNYASGKAGGRCAPRLGDCGARAGGAKSAGCAGRRRIVAALGRGSLLWAPTKRGREHRSQTTCRHQAPGFGSRRNSPSSAHMSSPLKPMHERPRARSRNVAQVSARRSS